MSPFAESTLATAQRYLDNAIALLEEHADAAVANPSLVGQTYVWNNNNNTVRNYRANVW